MSLNDIDFDAIEASVPTAVVNTEAGDVLYYMPSAMVAFRVNSLFTKEPETIQWIATFQPGELFVDIGANVGMYTIWAAKARHVRVYAFEPEAQNFAVLNKNILINELSDTVTAFPVALSDCRKFSVLNMSDLRVGGSQSSFHEAVDDHLKARTPAFQQGSVAITLDELIVAKEMPVPAHIKIDVDGFEHKVVAGAANVLADQRVRSVLIELNGELDEHRALSDVFAEKGFSERENSQRFAEQGSGNCLFSRPAP